jgi:hypothetical protein
MTGNNIVYDLILLEADRIERLKLKSPELYYKDNYGEIVKLAEPYDSDVEELISSIFKRKKTRYLITFAEAIEIQNKMSPSANKLLRFLAMEMGYGNILKGWGMRDINKATGISMRYLVSAMAQLCENDAIRFKVSKGRRVYMVNPLFFYKGSLKKIFSTTVAYNSVPKVAADMSEEFINEDFK